MAQVSPEVNDLDFLAALFGDAPEELQILIWTHERRSHWFRVADHRSATRVACELSASEDVYYGVALRTHDLGASKRGGVTESAGIPGVWFDLDLAAPGCHRATALPTRREEALGLVGEVFYEQPPSVVVDSGHGLHIYWLFREPWIFDNAEEREQAGSFVRRFQKTLLKGATGLGWQLDKTADLARQLRVPGTWNWKDRSQPVPVRVLQFEDRRYNPSDFEGFLLAPNEPRSSNRSAWANAPNNGRARRATSTRRTLPSLDPSSKAFILPCTSVNTCLTDVQGPETITREYLQVLGTSERFEQAACDLLRIPYQVGRRFCCILHREERPSSNLWRDPITGWLKYADFHARAEISHLTLPEVFAALHYRREQKLKAPEIMTWTLRMMVEAGLIPQASVDGPAVAEGVSPAAQKVWTGFRYLLACKWNYDHGKPTAFAYDFAAAWCGVGDREVREAVPELVRLGYLRRTGRHKGLVTLYLPGNGYPGELGSGEVSSSTATCSAAATPRSRPKVSTP